VKKLAAENYSKDKANSDGDPHRFEGVTPDVTLRIGLEIGSLHGGIAQRALSAAFVLISDCPGLPAELCIFRRGRLADILGRRRQVLAAYFVGGLRLFFDGFADRLGGFGGRAERLLGVLGAAAQFVLRRIGCLLAINVACLLAICLGHIPHKFLNRICQKVAHWQA
jgi:hypothetical protein